MRITPLPLEPFQDHRFLEWLQLLFVGYQKIHFTSYGDRVELWRFLMGEEGMLELYYTFWKERQDLVDQELTRILSEVAKYNKKFLSPQSKKEQAAKKERKKSKKGWVYLISRSPTECKIGSTSAIDPKTRLENLQIGSPSKLTLVGAFEPSRRLTTDTSNGVYKNIMMRKK